MRKLIAAGAAILIVIFVGLAMSTKSYSDPNIIEISGRIEAPETYITAGVNSKVQTVNVGEGEQVHRGQLLLTLDSRALKVKLQATGSQEALARQAQGMAGHQVAAVQSHVAEAQKKSRGFFAKIFTSKKKKEQVRAQLTQEMKSAQMQMLQAQAAVIRARAVKGEVAAKQSFFSLTSPLDGICVTRSVEPGEVVTAGQILLSIIDPEAIYMKGFIAEGDLSRVKLGQTVEILLDGAPHPLTGHITAIDTSPSFTPQNIYFKDDRVKQVFGIKIVIDKPDGTAKPGMPADARIDLRQTKNGNH
ncbi:MAG: HlyD family efflux transporter periplasmic adaptor subunit [Cyanobacteria bacterium SZAS LIN-3]|nr:HlyD family efflux transporter periplasmic adaptor subunit [Cyanobacteria bacterium SZAS LIN-3]